ncbi:MAG: hypothetical protein M1559_01270 [Candidatus Marsarchaeota archaeon]|nr:hypothetical protein [Candidatus Marsarchaeota archaeon]
MAILCERCKREIFRTFKCNYCGRNLCRNCVKSSKRKSKTVKLVICKDCWSEMPKRKAYKSDRETVA